MHRATTVMPAVRTMTIILMIVLLFSFQFLFLLSGKYNQFKYIAKSFRNQAKVRVHMKIESCSAGFSACGGSRSDKFCSAAVRSTRSAFLLYRKCDAISYKVKKYRLPSSKVSGTFKLVSIFRILPATLPVRIRYQKHNFLVSTSP